MKTIRRGTLRHHISCLTTAVLSLIALASLVSSPSLAGSFLLAPTRLFFEGSTRAQELTIMNQSDKVQTYRLRLEDRRLRENGEYDVITDLTDPLIASPMLRLSVRQIVIPGRSSATVRVLLRKPAGLSGGEVRSHLIVTELPIVNPPILNPEGAEGLSVSISTVFGISIPVLVRTGELVARVSGVTATRVPVLDHPEHENVEIKVDVAANRSMFIDLRLISTRQRRAEPIAASKSFAIYAPLTGRSITINLTAEQTVKLRAGNVVLQYQEVNRDGMPFGAVSEIAF